MVVFSIFTGKKINKTSIFMFVCTTVLYEYMTSFRNDVNNLFDITHVRIKIYGELYHCIIYITFAKRHVRVTFNFWYRLIAQSSLQSESVINSRTSAIVYTISNDSNKYTKIKTNNFEECTYIFYGCMGRCIPIFCQLVSHEDH